MAVGPTMATMLIVGQGYEDLRLFGVPLSLSPADGPGTRFGEWNDVELRIWWRLILEVQCLGWFLDRSKCPPGPCKNHPRNCWYDFFLCQQRLV